MSSSKAQAPSGSSPSTSAMNRGGSSRGRSSRGGLGKYLRARGRRGTGRPAVFSQRLLLEGEGPDGDEDDEEAKEAKREMMQKYSRRQLGSNADRYKEEAPELDEHGEPIVEPEVDLSAFLEKQRLVDDDSLPAPKDEDDGVDHDFDYLWATNAAPNKMKQKVEQIEWDDELDEMLKEKTAADASRELRDRFKAKADGLKKQPVGHVRKTEKDYAVAPPVPGAAPKTGKAELEDFLDDLLA